MNLESIFHSTYVSSIVLAADRSDLIDRGMIIQLERISDENIAHMFYYYEDIAADYNTIKPQLLSYIFDVLIEVLKLRGNGGIKVKRLPIMPPFAKTAKIISRCMGYPEDSFIDAFDKNIKLQAKEAIASNTVATAITKFIEHLYSIGSRNASIVAEKLHDGANCSLFWIGTPTKLLQVLRRAQARRHKNKRRLLL
jgi:hypothetical protein